MMHQLKLGEDNPPAVLGSRRGFLIDFDYAFVSDTNEKLTAQKLLKAKTRKKPAISAGHRTVSDI